MPMLGEPYGRYMRLLNNLSYLFWVWAHEAKRFNSFAAAKHYLRAISLINVRKTRVVPNFKPEDIDTLVERVDRAGISATGTGSSFRTSRCRPNANGINNLVSHLRHRLPYLRHQMPLSQGLLISRGKSPRS